jgi:hypothetical protein
MCDSKASDAMNRTMARGRAQEQYAVPHEYNLNFMFGVTTKKL